MSQRNLHDFCHQTYYSSLHPVRPSLGSTHDEAAHSLPEQRMPQHALESGSEWKRKEHKNREVSQMNDDDVGKVFLWALPWDWTVVGRFEGFVGEGDGRRLMVSQAGYFTKTGATFDKLCKTGFVEETEFHQIKTSGGRIRIQDAGMIFPWESEWPPNLWKIGKKG
jgi:hypothetical protein